MNILIDNITRNEIDGSQGYSYSVTVGDVTINDCFEHDDVLFGDCADTWFDVQGRQQVIAALEKRYSDDEIFGATVDLFDVIVKSLRCTISGARSWISTAKDLDHLLEILSTLKKDMPRQDLQSLDITSLPTFGGSPPADTTGIWSWDQDRILVGSNIGDMTIMDR